MRKNIVIKVIRLLIVLEKLVINNINEDNGNDLNINISNDITNNNNNNNNQYIPPHYNWYLMYQISRILIQNGNNLNDNLNGGEIGGILITIGISLIFLSYYLYNKDNNSIEDEDNNNVEEDNNI